MQGSLVRAVRRVEEVLRQAAAGAAVMGESGLVALFQEGQRAHQARHRVRGLALPLKQTVPLLLPCAPLLVLKHCKHFFLLPPGLTSHHRHISSTVKASFRVPQIISHALCSEPVSVTYTEQKHKQGASQKHLSQKGPAMPQHQAVGALASRAQCTAECPQHSGAQRPETALTASSLRRVALLPSLLQQALQPLRPAQARGSPCAGGFAGRAVPKRSRAHLHMAHEATRAAQVAVQLRHRLQAVPRAAHQVAHHPARSM